jgi:predicted short-subunit dehydrogenase-like oxidoreductase (DUF2520 family)
MSYLIIGDGKLARHFSHYLQLLNLPFVTWSRPHTLEPLKKLADSSKIILVLISDHAIEEFIKENSFLQNKIVVHCSGCLVTPLAYSAHPLFSFSEQLFDLNTYQKIPFILQDQGPDFIQLLPGLSNPHFKIPSALKPYYHSLCVLANNFTQRIWERFFTEMATQFNIPREALMPYLENTLHNVQMQQAFTGPLARGDKATIEQHLAALQGSPLQQLYKILLLENAL